LCKIVARNELSRLVSLEINICYDLILFYIFFLAMELYNEFLKNRPGTGK